MSKNIAKLGDRPPPTVRVPNAAPPSRASSAASTPSLLAAGQGSLGCQDLKETWNTSQDDKKANMKTTKALPSSFRSGGLLPYSVRLGWGNLLAFMTAALFVLQARSEQDPWLRGSCHPLGQHSFRIPGPAVCPASRGPQRARHASSARAQRRTPGRTAHKAWRRLRHTSDPSGAAFASSLAS